MRPVQAIRTLFSQGLRFFFLAAGVYAVLAMAVWIGWLGTFAAGAAPPELPFAPPPNQWHAHELIFGYAGAVLGGFFLTAVPSWTGAPAARARLLSLLVVAWLTGRLAVWWSGALAPALVAALDLAFLLLLILKISVQLARRPKPQNLLFVGILALLWIGNLLVHLDWIGLTPGSAAAGLRQGLLAIAAMIAVLGGRITPAFTLNAMRRAGHEIGLPRISNPANPVGIAAAILLPVCIGIGVPDGITAVVALVAGLAQLARLSGWRTLWTLDEPILWSLHLGAGMLGVGYLALAAAYAGWTSELGALHLIGIGAVGGMTLAMMTRAALGHTGRELAAARPITWAYTMIASAALLRSVGAELGPGWYDWSVLISGALWLLAFSLFVTIYWPVLTRPRQAPPS